MYIDRHGTEQFDQCLRNPSSAQHPGAVLRQRLEGSTVRCLISRSSRFRLRGRQAFAPQAEGQCTRMPMTGPQRDVISAHRWSQFSMERGRMCRGTALTQNTGSGAGWNITEPLNPLCPRRYSPSQELLTDIRWFR